MSTPIHDGGPAFPHEANETVTQTVMYGSANVVIPRGKRQSYRNHKRKKNRRKK